MGRSLTPHCPGGCCPSQRGLFFPSSPVPCPPAPSRPSLWPSCCSRFCSGPQPDPRLVLGLGGWSRACRREEGSASPAQDPALPRRSRDPHPGAATPRSIPSSAGAAFPPGWGSPSYPIPPHPSPSHPIPSHLVPSHPIPHHTLPTALRDPPNRGTTDTPRGQMGAHPPGCAGRARGDPGESLTRLPGALGWPRRERGGPGRRGRRCPHQYMCRAAAGPQLRRAHSVWLCPASRPSLGTDPDIPCSWLFVLSADCWQAAGRSRSPRPGGPAGACSRPQHPAQAIAPPSALRRGGWRPALGQCARRPLKATLTSAVPVVPTAAAPPRSVLPHTLRSQPQLPAAGLCTGVRGTEPWALVALGTPGDTQQRIDPCQAASLHGNPKSPWGPGTGGVGQSPPGWRGRAASPGASARCREAWRAGACPGLSQTTQKPAGRRRLTHGRVLEAEISRSSAGADVAAAARARGLGAGQRARRCGGQTLRPGQAEDGELPRGGRHRGRAVEKPGPHTTTCGKRRRQGNPWAAF